MDLVSVVTSQMSDSRSNELEASSSSQVTDYDSRVDTPITVEQYPGLCDSRPNKLISSASAASESGYNSYCNHSCISTDEAHSTTHRTYCNFDKTEAQFCINTLQSSENLSNRACQNLQCAHATNSEGSKLNQNDNNSFSNVLAAAIGHNYAPKDFSTFASNLCCQSNIMSTPDTENRNTNQGCFKSNHDVLWTGKVSDQCNDLSITSSEDSNHNNDSLQTEVHNYVKNENGSCCSFSPLLPSHTCHYNYHHDREEKSKMAFFSNLPEVAYNLVNTHSQTYGTEALDCVNFQQSVGDNSTSTQEDSSEGDCKSSKGSFVYIQKPSVNWPQVDRFYEIKPRLDHTPELNSKMSMHIDYTNPAHYSSDFGIQCSPQEHLMNGPNILPSNEVSSYNSKPSKVNLHKVKNMSALLSAAQMSGNCPSSSILTSNISKFFLINSTTGVSLQPQSTEDHAKTKGDEHNYHSAVVPWHLQIQFSSDQGLARENASYSDYNPRSHQTDNTNVTQGGFCTHANTPSTYFDFSSLHSERKDGSLDGSVSGKAVLATEKNPSRSWTRKTSKSSRCTPRLKPKIAWDASSSTRNKPLGEDAVSVMESWYESHTDNPYPTASEKEQIAALGGITVMQVCSWFANRRTRTANTKPKKNRRKLHSKIHDLCIEIERATNKVINAENLEERIGQIIDEYLV